MTDEIPGGNIEAIYIPGQFVCNHGVHLDDYCRECNREAADYERRTGQPIIGGDSE